MATFSDLKARVLRNIIDPVPSVQEAVGDLVNQTIALAQNKHDFWVQISQADFVTAEGNASLGAIPATWKKWYGKPWRTEYLGAVHGLSWTPSPTAFHLAYPTDVNGAPRLLYASGSTISVAPIPDALSDYSDGNYRVSVPYIAQLPALSADTDTNWFTINGERWIEFQATSDAFYLNWDEQRAALWAARAADEWKTLIRLDAQLWTSGITTLAPHSDANGSNTEK